jgi:hypothetical protein
MWRLVVAAVLGVLVGAAVGGGVSLLGFAYPVHTEIGNLPLDDDGNLKVTGTMETVIGAGPAEQTQGSSSDLLDWRDGPTLQCVCSETEYIDWPGAPSQLLLLSFIASQPRGR